MTIRKGSNIIAGNPSLSSVVTLDTPQTITSSKTFTGTTMVPTATAGTNDGKAASTEFVNTAINSSPIILPGMVIVWAGTTVPEGYLLCDGSAVSRTTYSALFSAIGTTYGPGDSSSTFNLPNFQDRVIQGSGTRGNVGTYKSESLPNITGTLGGSATTGNAVSGAFYKRTTPIASPTYGGIVSPPDYGIAGFNAFLSSSTYQDNSPVQPNAILIQCCIKY